MYKTLQLAVVLSAYDRMSRVVNDAVTKSERRLADLRKKSQDNLRDGVAFGGVGAGMIASLAPAVKAYAELEDASLSLKTAMMQDGGQVSNLFGDVDKLAVKLGNKLPGTTRDFYQMFETMLNQGIPAQMLLDGVGESAAYLGVALNIPYDEAGKLAAKLKEATGTANKDMLAFMDTITRVKNVGVESGEMQYAFGRSAGALKLMNIQGLEASKSLAAVYAMLIRTGMSGETVGTGFSTVLNSILNKDKMAAANNAARAFGITLDFVDSKTGEFKGVENMVAQFDKLKNLKAEDRASIVNALTGGGQDASMLQTLITNGVEGFNKMQKSLAGQANLQDKVNEKLKGAKAMWEAAKGNIENAKAALAAGFMPEVKKLTELLGQAAAFLAEFLANNPRIAKAIGLFTAIVGVFFSILSVIKLIRGVMIALNLVLAVNPFIAIAMGIILAVTLLYVYWDKIWAWLKKNWQYVVGAIMPFLLIPMLIIKHWDKIKVFFSKLWQGIKNLWNDGISWIKNLGTTFFNAGANIIKQLWEGMKSMANKPVQAIKDIAAEVRSYLPFSPAKQGALKDIHKIKLIETIAASIKPFPLVRAVDAVTRTVANHSAPGMGRPAVAQAAGGGSVVIHYNPTVNLSGTTDKAAFLEILRKHKDDIFKMVEEAASRRGRLKF